MVFSGNAEESEIVEEKLRDLSYLMSSADCLGLTAVHRYSAKEDRKPNILILLFDEFLIVINIQQTVMVLKISLSLQSEDSSPRWKLLCSASLAA